ncbi:MAG: SOS response-associated peptidase [Hyphomonadaceae bacterium]
MCGKFTQRHTWPQIWRQLNAIANADGVTTSTPMREAAILHLDAAGARAFTPMRWGFAAKNSKTPERLGHVHARSETIDALPTFADAFAHRRGVLIVETFNEGEELPNGKTKQYVIRPKDGRPLGIAVIYEGWTNGAERLETFVMVTTPPNPLIAAITDRMPAILREEDWPLWLGETDAPLADVKALLRPMEDAGEWEMTPQDAPRSGRRAPDGQPGLF